MKHIAHKKLAVLLRIALMIAALVCGAIFFWFLPQLGRGIALADPEYAWAFWPLRMCRVPSFAAFARHWPLPSGLALSTRYSVSGWRRVQSSTVCAALSASSAPL